MNSKLAREGQEKKEKRGRNRSGKARRGGEKGKTKREGGRLKAERKNKGEVWDKG